jgi:hypothetical protein
MSGNPFGRRRGGPGMGGEGFPGEEGMYPGGMPGMMGRGRA